MTRGVAAFDFDGTITKRDTLVPFLFRQGPVRFPFVGAWATIRSVVPGGARNDLTYRDRAKRNLVHSLFAGIDAEAVEGAGQEYSHGFDRLYREDMLERIGWHRDQGHMLVLVTASLGAYARPAGTALGFNHVIATELEADADGRLTGELAGPNVRGREKALRLTSLLDTVLGAEPRDEPGDVGPELWAYGNSRGDAELLAMADHKTWVGRSRRPSEE